MSNDIQRTEAQIDAIIAEGLCPWCDWWNRRSRSYGRALAIQHHLDWFAGIGAHPEKPQ